MFLGIDLGTSELKALLLDRRHQRCGVARAPLTVQRPEPTWSEQNPADWWMALVYAMDQLKTHHGAALSQVEGIGLSGQMHGAVLMDADHQVLRPAMLWNDGRSQAQCGQLQAQCPAIQQITGNQPMPGLTAPKLLWVKQHEPSVFAKVRHVALPKDWLGWQLTGELTTDLSDASGTLWLNCGLRDWSDEALKATGLHRRHMPRLSEGSERSGWLRLDLCRRWGLPTRVAVAAGGGDNAASAVGMGLIHPGQGFVSLGTSGVIFRVSDGFQPVPEKGVHAFCHALANRWHQMSVMLSAASAVRWAASVLGHQDEASLLEAAASLSFEKRKQAPLFFPYLSGERTPHNQSMASAAWWGLNASHDRADMSYAVAEGVAMGLRDGWKALGPSSNPSSSLALVGGGGRSDWWAQLLADALDLELTQHEGGHEGAALGAARLAWLSCGGDELEVCQVPPLKQRWQPQAHSALGLRSRHEHFEATTQAVMPWLVKRATH